VGETTTRAAGVVVTVIYAALIAWLYARQPQTIAQVTGGLSAAVGAYRIDEPAFADGLRLFHEDRFVEARMAFGRADPAERDAQTQFYIAYTFYRQGGDAYITTTRSTVQASRRSTARLRSGRTDG